MTPNLSAIAVGRLVPIKNFDVVLDAWTEIPIPLKIVGYGPSYNDLADHSERLGLLNRVEFLGERTDVADLMAQSDLLVAASEKEGFSYAVLEALRSELVVVSTNTGIAAELIPSKYLIDEANSNLLSGAVLETITSWDLAKKEFEEVWHRACQFTKSRMVSLTEGVYLHSLGLPPRKSN
ncbi:MAG: glycosyltransferase [Gammaproteobacteria bacterium]|nr:glycosyltransferase [Gammaproteobacteria bacterium]